MIWIILGVILWSAAHFFKRVAPDVRAGMGDAGKGVVAVLSVVAIVLMVIGYRAADVTPLWDLGMGAISANNTLMLFAIALFGLGHSKSRLRGKIRHPMLTGFLVWVVAHLLANGDMPSLVLFGGLGLWAAASIVVLNKVEPVPEPFKGGTIAGDIRLLIITLVIYGVIAGVHTWLGRWPFPG